MWNVPDIRLVVISNDFAQHIATIVHSEVNRHNTINIFSSVCPTLPGDIRWFTTSAPTAFLLQPLTNTPDSTNQMLLSVIETGVIFLQLFLIYIEIWVFFFLPYPEWI